MIPAAFRERMTAALGDESADFLRALEAAPAKGLRVNTLKTRPDYALPFALTPVPWAENGYYYDEAERPGRSWMHEAGLYYLQEPSAMCAAAILAPRSDECVLDLCAAPGGKTTHAACLMGDGGLLVANEINASRARILAENVRRMGLTHTVVTNEPPARLCARWRGCFDAVLVDAPCSGEGMFRKNGDAGREWSPEGVRACAARQAQILDTAAEAVRTGGRIVYSTCTFSEEENEVAVAKFLERHPDFEAARIERAGMSRGFDPAGKTARIFPHRARGEGHFVALLVRTGGNVSRRFPRGASVGADRRRLADYERFAAETLVRKPRGTPMVWGDTLYAVGDIPDLSGVRTLLPGLELGAFLKGRFEPAHALGLALSPADARAVAFSPDEAARYYAGEAIPADAPDGWALAATDGYALGWVKVTDGLAKNRVPKALRKAFSAD